MSIAVVTGAGGALGRAIARRLAVDGHAVAVVDIDADAAEATRKDVAAHGGAVRSWTLDLRDADAVNEMFNVVGVQSGGTDILVNNAAITRPPRSSRSPRPITTMCTRSTSAVTRCVPRPRHARW